MLRKYKQTAWLSIGAYWCTLISTGFRTAPSLLPSRHRLAPNLFARSSLRRYDSGQVDPSGAGCFSAAVSGHPPSVKSPATGAEHYEELGWWALKAQPACLIIARKENTTPNQTRTMEQLFTSSAGLLAWWKLPGRRPPPSHSTSELLKFQDELSGTTNSRSSKFKEYLRGTAKSQGELQAEAKPIKIRKVTPEFSVWAQPVTCLPFWSKLPPCLPIQCWHGDPVSCQVHLPVFSRAAGCEQQLFI